MTTPPTPLVGESCERSTLPPAVRLAITFATLLALKYGLPAAGVPPAATVLVLLVVATFFAWRFWWRCRADRRGPLLLIASLWIAGIAKLVLLSR